MKIELKHIVLQSWKLLVAAPQSWDEIAVQQATLRDIRSSYVYPWILVCVCFVFLSNLIFADEQAFQKAFLESFITTAALFGGYFIVIKITNWFLKKQNIETDNIKTEKLVAYSLTTIFVLKFLIAVFPSLFFLQVLSIHVAYLIWEGCRSIFNIKEDDRGNIVLVLSLSIIFVPIIISKIIHLMLPNV